MPQNTSKQVNLYDAKTHLSQLVKEAAAGQEIIIANAGEPVARLVSLATTSKQQRKPGRLKGQIWVADDFDDPLPPDVLAAFHEGEELPAPSPAPSPARPRSSRAPRKRKKR